MKFSTNFIIYGLHNFNIKKLTIQLQQFSDKNIQNYIYENKEIAKIRRDFFYAPNNYKLKFQ